MVVDVVVVVVMVVVVVVVSVSVVDVRVLDVLVRVDDVLVVEVAVMVVVATFTSYLKYVVPPWATSHRSAVWCLPMVHHLSLWCSGEQPRSWYSTRLPGMRYTAPHWLFRSQPAFAFT